MDTDSKSEIGKTVGLIDAMAAIAAQLVEREWFSEEVQEALKDIRQDDNLKRIMDMGALEHAKDYILQQHKMADSLTKALELSNKLAANNWE